MNIKQAHHPDLSPSIQLSLLRYSQSGTVQLPPKKPLKLALQFAPIF